MDDRKEIEWLCVLGISSMSFFYFAEIWDVTCGAVRTDGRKSCKLEEVAVLKCGTGIVCTEDN